MLAVNFKSQSSIRLSMKLQLHTVQDYYYTILFYRLTYTVAEFVANLIRLLT